MGSEHKPDLNNAGETAPDYTDRKLIKVHPVNIAGSGILTTDIEGDPDDNFAIVNPSLRAQPDTRATARETGYALLDRTDVPKTLAEGLRTYRRIRRKKQKEARDRARTPIKYAPLEDPPEID